MFYGEHEHTIDKKGRIIVPSRFREFLKEYDIKHCYITRGLDRCLFLFTEDEWKAQESKFKAIPFTKSEARKFNRLYFSGAVQVDCDLQGRILLPKYLKDFAEIKRDIMIIGVSNRIEIWAKEEYEKHVNLPDGDFAVLGEKVLGEKVLGDPPKTQS